MHKLSYYDILGVGRSASDDEIERAYRRRALEHHPDHHPNDARANTAMQALTEAAQTLRSVTRRRAYDNMLQQDERAAPTLRCNWLAGDVLYPLTISPQEAENGVRHVAHFHTATGQPYSISIDLPPGIAHGAQIIVPGAGGPAREGSGRGNLIVQVVVRT